MKAIEAAWQNVMSARDMPRDDDPNYDRWLFEASIKEFCTALSEDDAAVERIGKAANVAWHKWLADSMNTSTSLDAIGSPAQACGRAAIRAMGGE